MITCQYLYDKIFDIFAFFDESNTFSFQKTKKAARSFLSARLRFCFFYASQLFLRVCKFSSSSLGRREPNCS